MSAVLELVYANSAVGYPVNCSLSFKVSCARERTRTMSLHRRWVWQTGWVVPLFVTALAFGQATRDSTTYRRMKVALDAIPAIDTHDHLWPFDRLPGWSKPSAAKA